MRNHFGYLLLLLCGSWAGNRRAQAQTCGGGMRVIEVRWPDGRPVDSLHYEVREVVGYYEKTRDRLDTYHRQRHPQQPQYLLSDYINSQQQELRYGQAALVPLDSADASYLQRRHLLVPPSKFIREVMKFSATGPVANGICQFTTHEGGGTVYVLTLISATQKFYLISKLFTGCNNHPFVVVWGHAPHLQTPPVSRQEAEAARREAERK